MRSLRRFTSLCLGFSFLVISYTGIFLFIAPKGRVANWTNWELWGLDKTQYTNLHVTFMVLFLAAALLHTYLNWDILMGYLKNKVRSFSLLTKEFILAFAINLLFIVGTLYYWSPFDEFLDFEDEIKTSWEQKSASKAPYGHAELSTLEEFAMRTNTNLSTLLEKLRLAKLKGVDAAKSIADIAKENGYSPAQMFDVLNSPEKTQTAALPEGGGYGKMSLKEASERYAFSLQKALAHLREKGYDATEDATLKESADALHVRPIELLETLRKESK
jgi:AraC-like DNA-binding protein